MLQSKGNPKLKSLFPGRTFFDFYHKIITFYVFFKQEFLNLFNNTLILASGRIFLIFELGNKKENFDIILTLFLNQYQNNLF